jgi:hypothetical protein
MEFSPATKLDTSVSSVLSGILSTGEEYEKCIGSIGDNDTGEGDTGEGI